ncbi:UNVERIFIED_CONTAM: hypothetical protein HDU68_009656 [Siphonaria sp. JEL0065]|nr:hypothetical protein HDU68_009656 [Siphonaria sp. JEL0065]
MNSNDDPFSSASSSANASRVRNSLSDVSNVNSDKPPTPHAKLRILSNIPVSAKSSASAQVSAGHAFGAFDTEVPGQAASVRTTTTTTPRSQLLRDISRISLPDNSDESLLANVSFPKADLLSDASFLDSAANASTASLKNDWKDSAAFFRKAASTESTLKPLMDTLNNNNKEKEKEKIPSDNEDDAVEVLAGMAGGFAKKSSTLTFKPAENKDTPPQQEPQQEFQQSQKQQSLFSSNFSFPPLPPTQTTSTDKKPFVFKPVDSFSFKPRDSSTFSFNPVKPNANVDSEKPIESKQPSQQRPFSFSSVPPVATKDTEIPAPFSAPFSFNSGADKTMTAAEKPHVFSNTFSFNSSVLMGDNTVSKPTFSFAPVPAPLDAALKSDTVSKPTFSFDNRPTIPNPTTQSSTGVMSKPPLDSAFSFSKIDPTDKTGVQVKVDSATALSSVSNLPTDPLSESNTPQPLITEVTSIDEKEDAKATEVPSNTAALATKELSPITPSTASPVESILQSTQETVKPTSNLFSTGYSFKPALLRQKVPVPGTPISEPGPAACEAKLQQYEQIKTKKPTGSNTATTASKFSFDAVPVTPSTVANMISMSGIGAVVADKGVTGIPTGTSAKEKPKSSMLLSSIVALDDDEEVDEKDVFGKESANGAVGIEEKKVGVSEPVVTQIAEKKVVDGPLVPIVPLPSFSFSFPVAASAAEKTDKPVEEKQLPRSLFIHEKIKSWKTLVVPPSPAVSTCITPTLNINHPALPTKPSRFVENVQQTESSTEDLQSIRVVVENPFLSTSEEVVMTAGGSSSHSNQNIRSSSSQAANVTPPSKIPIPLARSSSKPAVGTLPSSSSVSSSSATASEKTNSAKETTPKATPAAASLKPFSLQSLISPVFSAAELAPIQNSTVAAEIPTIPTALQLSTAIDMMEFSMEEDDEDEKNGVVEVEGSNSLLLNESAEYETIPDDLSAPRLDLSFSQIGGNDSVANAMEASAEDVAEQGEIGIKEKDGLMETGLFGGDSFDVSVIGVVDVQEEGEEEVMVVATEEGEQAVEDANVAVSSKIVAATGGSKAGKRSGGNQQQQQSQSDFAPRGSLGPGSNSNAKRGTASTGNGGDENGDDDDSRRRPTESGHKVERPSRSKQTAAAVHSKLDSVFKLKNGVASGDLIKKRDDENLEDVQDRLVAEFGKALEKALESIEKDKMDEE